MVVAKDHIFDFVPLNAGDPETLTSLLSLKSVAGEIRLLGKKQTQASLVERAENFAKNYPNCDLHLVSNNCWTFALLMLWELKGKGDDSDLV